MSTVLFVYDQDMTGIYLYTGVFQSLRIWYLSVYIQVMQHDETIAEEKIKTAFAYTLRHIRSNGSMMVQ